MCVPKSLLAFLVQIFQNVDKFGIILTCTTHTKSMFQKVYLNSKSFLYALNFYNFFCKPLTCFECLVRVESINYFWKQLQEIHRKM